LSTRRVHFVHFHSDLMNQNGGKNVAKNLN
jgi:hypothetical protein